MIDWKNRMLQVLFEVRYDLAEVMQFIVSVLEVLMSLWNILSKSSISMF